MTSTMANHDTGWNEFFIPLEKIDEDSIKITKVVKTNSQDKYFDMLYLLSYSTHEFTFPNVSILTPFMKIHSWDCTTGRLEFEIEPDSTEYIKFCKIQEIIFKYLISHIADLNKYGIYTKTELFNTLKQIVYKNIFAVYLHGPNPQQKKAGRVWLLNSLGWEKGVSTDTFKKGNRARIAFRFQGISHSDSSSSASKKLKCRLRHQTVAIIQELS
jgi:hypothetical protein